MKTALIRLTFLALVLAGLSACANSVAQRSPRDQALYHYVSAIRWSDFDVAQNFIDPMVKEANPLSDAELERYRQFQVAGYEVKSGREPSEHEYEQVVEIRLVNKNTQVEKIILDRQQWRWDPVAQAWYLMSGLPDLDATR